MIRILPFMNDYAQRIAEALERLAPPAKTIAALDDAHPAYLWHPSKKLIALHRIRAHPLEMLLSIEDQKRLLLENTQNFAQGFGANNALLWGARGVGKSSLVKSICTVVHQQYPNFCLIEIPRTCLADLPDLLEMFQQVPRRMVLFCDDLSFEPEDDAYKALKSILDGSLLDVSGNCLFYATSNRRHLMSRDMSENEQRAVIHQDEIAQERLSLTDRFGLWLGFHNIDQDAYLAMIEGYVVHFDLRWSAENITDYDEALRWSRVRGSRSGRVAWQYVTNLAGRQGKAI